MFARRCAAQVFVLIAGQAWRGKAECAFRLDGNLNISEPLALIAPVVNPGSGYRLINPYNPIVYLVNETIYERYEVSCSVDSWEYELAGGEYVTNVTFPDGNSTKVACEGLFSAEGSELFIDDYTADKAVAISDSLFGRTIKVSLTCDQDPVLEEEDSCLLFMLNFTNTSPEVDEELLESALYRFEEPAIPGVVLPPSGNSSPGDTWLNEGNPIVNTDGTVTDTGCNGDESEYLGEDGEWYQYYTGKDGETYNLTHVFYATEQDHLNVVKIQSAWSPNLEYALYNRTMRTLIYCNNVNAREEGYIFFTVGSSFGVSTDEYEAILSSGAPAAVAGPWGGGWLSSLSSFVAVGVLTAFVGKFSESC